MQKLCRFADQFYPASPRELSAQIEAFLDSVGVSDVKGELKGIIVPHAGYVYSGQTAAYGYKALQKSLNTVEHWRVLLLGPSHAVPIPEGKVLTQSYTAWQTPLGQVKVDPVPGGGVFEENNLAFDLEHSLEVQLPFLQTIFGSRAAGGFSITPLLINLSSPLSYESIRTKIGEDALWVISSDLSHYLPQAQAEMADKASFNIINSLDLENLGNVDACGQAAIGCLMYIAKKEGWRVQQLAYSTSGQASGDYEKVVGYGSWALTRAVDIAKI